MLNKKIKYTDFNGVEKTWDAYFNLNKSEITMWLATDGDYSMDKVMERLYKEGNKKKIMEIFEDLIRRTYGVLSLDGVSFLKRDEDYELFKGSPAYDKLFMELISDAKVASDFFNAVIPTDIAEEVAKVISDHPEAIPDELKEYIS